MEARWSSERRKRARPSAENSPVPSSIKKRRLNDAAASSPSTPKALRAIASAISGAFGFSRQVSDNNTVADSVYDVPDSDDDGSGVAAHLAERAGSNSRRTTKNPSVSMYEIPDSDRELVSPPARRRGRPPGSSTKTKGLNGVHTKAASGKSMGRRRHHGSDEVADSDEGKARWSVAKPAPESDTRRSRVGNARRQVSESLPNGSTTLKGILTPSKKGKVGRPKSVTFGANMNDYGGAEVFFEDLPNKVSKTKAKETRTQPAKAILAGEESSQGANDEVEEEQEEDESEDDEVCAICSKPDSKAPNEIIFCDNCDMAVHQECYNVPEIPEGDWLCRSCSQEDISRTPKSASTVKVTAATVPDIANFDHHLRSLQRVLLDRCTGRRRLKLLHLEDAYAKVHQLVEQSVLVGEGNSMLVIGPRGCGKTTLVENVITDLSQKHRSDFHVVRLNGFIHTDDKLALREIWRQLGKEMEVEDDLVNRTNYADTLTSLLAVLSHPAEIAAIEEGVTSRSVIFVIDEFDMFATHPRQTLLYNLFDIAQARKAPIAVLGCTTRIDVVEMLEKRVKSRFSHRYVFLSPPKNVPVFWEICKQGLCVDEDDLEAEGIDTGVEGHAEFQRYWNKNIDTLYKQASFQKVLHYHYYTAKSASAFLTSCILPLSTLSPQSPTLEIKSAAGLAILSGPRSKLHLLSALSDLDLGLLIAATRLDIVAHTDTVNFAMAYDEYGSLMGKQRVQSASSGMLALGGGVRVWGRGVAYISWERLVALGLLVPAGIGGGRAGHSGLEGKMWRVDVALEEIPTALKLSTILAKWCKEI